MDLHLLEEWFKELEPVGAALDGGVTRLAYSSEEDEMFDRVSSFARRLGFAVTSDCIGNMFISFPGQEGVPCHVTGSHLDSVPRGGRYDGVAGVLAGLLVMEKQGDSGFLSRYELPFSGPKSQACTDLPRQAAGRSQGASASTSSGTRNPFPGAACTTP